MNAQRLERAILLIGAGLILAAFVGMSIRPYDRGDMRVLDWVGLQGIVTAVGLTMVIGVGIAKAVRRFRRR